MSQITHFCPNIFCLKYCGLGIFWTNFNSEEIWRRLAFMTYNLSCAPFSHFNMSLKKSVHIHFVNVCFLGDWPVLQFLGERLRGQVGRQCYFLLSGLILSRFLLQKVPQCYFFSQMIISIWFSCQCIGWWWWRFFYHKIILVYINIYHSCSFSLQMSALLGFFIIYLF